MGVGGGEKVAYGRRVDSTVPDNQSVDRNTNPPVVLVMGGTTGG